MLRRQGKFAIRYGKLDTPSYTFLFDASEIHTNNVSSYLKVSNPQHRYIILFLVSARQVQQAFCTKGLGFVLYAKSGQCVILCIAKMTQNFKIFEFSFFKVSQLNIFRHSLTPNLLHRKSKFNLRYIRSTRHPLQRTMHKY